MIPLHKYLPEKILMQGALKTKCDSSKIGYVVENYVHQQICVPVDPERSCWIEVANLLIFLHWEMVKITCGCRYMTAVFSASVQNVWFYGDIISCVSLYGKIGYPVT